MTRRGRPPVEIQLTGNERRQLQSWARRHSSSQALAMRCKIVLFCEDPDLTGGEIAAKVGCNPATVSKWRKRFAERRLDGLIDEPRPGAQRTISDDLVEQVVIDTLETTPPDATHWSTRSLAAKHGISHQTVSEIWRAFGLKPWQQDEFKISPERWFSALTTKKRQRSAHDSVNALAADITDWVEHWNENPTPFIWHQTADEILERRSRYCADLTNTELSTEPS